MTRTALIIAALAVALPSPATAAPSEPATVSKKDRERAAKSPHKLAPPRPGDVAHSLADLTHARAVLGFEPVVGFEDGLAATCAWYRNALE